MHDTHIDPFAPYFSGERRAERRDERLGGRVQDRVRARDGRRRRGRVHKTSLELLCDETLQKQMSDLHGARRVALQVGHVLVKVMGLEKPCHHVSRVQEAALHVDIIGGRRDLIEITAFSTAEIDPYLAELHVRERRTQVVKGVLQQLIIQRNENDRQTLGRQPLGQRQTDAGGRARDQHPFCVVRPLQVLRAEEGEEEVRDEVPHEDRQAGEEREFLEDLTGDWRDRA
mmetsp:Transcript_14566/g.41490  ORF Transcript_14566/g.41490 Transcript_14566/m.41490 type:complete len:229 (-) Transcript_14566:32-718(-)